MESRLRLMLAFLAMFSLTLAAVSVIAAEDSEATGAYTVSFQVNGGTGTETEWTVRGGNSIELPTNLFSRSGYYLSGWTSNLNTYSPGADFTVNANTEFKAQWTKIEADSISDSKTAVAGEEFVFEAFGSDLVSSSDPWYYFQIMYREATGSGAAAPGKLVFVQELSWLTVEEKDKGITFTGTPANPGVYYVEVAVGLSRDSYEPSEGSKVGLVIHVLSSSDNTYKVSFSAGSGTGSVSSLSGRDGTAVALPGEGAMTRSGYALAGWDIDERGTTVTYPLGSYYTFDGKSITATAHWLAEANVVILDGSGQIGNELTAFVGYENETISLPEDGYSKDGSTFLGWRLTSAPDEIYALGYIYTIHGPTYMTAYYAPSGAATCSVTYDSNGGTGALSQSVESGMKVVLPAKGFSSSTNLEGWTSSADGETYGPGEVVEVTSDVTFTAVWGTSAPDVVTVSFDLNGGSGSMGTQILDYGALATEPEAPRKTACVFKGWVVVGGGSFDFSEPVYSSVTLRADWEQHFTRTYEGTGTVRITMASAYASAPTVVDWGDGTSSSGMSSFVHVYKQTSSGTITVNSTVGASGQTATSTASYSVTGASGPEDGGGESDGDADGFPVWTVALAIAAIALLLIVAKVRM